VTRKAVDFKHASVSSYYPSHCIPSISPCTFNAHNVNQGPVGLISKSIQSIQSPHGPLTDIKASMNINKRLLPLISFHSFPIIGQGTGIPNHSFTKHSSDSVQASPSSHHVSTTELSFSTQRIHHSISSQVQVHMHSSSYM
jgi:hypothetical protein